MGHSTHTKGCYVQVLHLLYSLVSSQFVNPPVGTHVIEHSAQDIASENSALHDRTAEVLQSSVLLVTR
uniref:Secreted protein n=1 Tax=Ciona savignyi TaxID=51511 RepID=H2YZ08_CIOSA